MDHSVYCYLCRRPTPVLQALLQQYASSDPEDIYDPQIPLLVEQILAQRATETVDDAT